MTEKQKLSLPEITRVWAVSSVASRLTGSYITACEFGGSEGELSSDRLNQIFSSCCYVTCMFPTSTTSISQTCFHCCFWVSTDQDLSQN
ncbi:hypothetical protein AOLI_G00019660 [Acnodon oligacanthus]